VGDCCLTTIQQFFRKEEEKGKQTEIETMKQKQTKQKTNNKSKFTH